MSASSPGQILTCREKSLRNDRGPFSSLCPSPSASSWTPPQSRELRGARPPRGRFEARTRGPGALNSPWRARARDAEHLPRVCHPLASPPILLWSRASDVAAWGATGLPLASSAFRPDVPLLTTRACSSRACPSSSPCTTQRSSPPAGTPYEAKVLHASRSAARFVGLLRRRAFPEATRDEIKYGR